MLDGVMVVLHFLLPRICLSKQYPGAMEWGLAQNKPSSCWECDHPCAVCNFAQVGISSVWYEGNPCNMHLMDLAADVKAGVEEAGLVGYRFNTIGVSDAISMGTDGMSYSLQSRDLIADSVETVMSAQVAPCPIP